MLSSHKPATYATRRLRYVALATALIAVSLSLWYVSRRLEYVCTAPLYHSFPVLSIVEELMSILDIHAQHAPVANYPRLGDSDRTPNTTGTPQNTGFC